MPPTPYDRFDGKAWLAGETVSGAKLNYNQRVRAVTGEYEGEEGWVVGIEPRDVEPIYTVEFPEAHPCAEVPESSLAPAA